MCVRGINMDFLDTEKVYFNGQEVIKVFFEGDLVWSKMEGQINVDHKTDETADGVWDKNSGCFLI